jgi:hypothetical protein
MATKITATIENLRNGKCAVRNDGKPSELREVLKVAFPRDTTTTSGSYEYYYSKFGKGLWSVLSICHLPAFSVKEFLKDINKQKTPMKNRTIKPQQAQSIINIACAGVWKPKLAKLWAEDIVMGNDITITEVSYKEMRKACNDAQNKLFDTIFGKDVKPFTAKKGEWVVIVSGDVDYIYFNLKTPYQLREDLISEIGVFKVVDDSKGGQNGYTDIKDFVFRKATAAEIKEASWYPHLTPCLVKHATNIWVFRYSAKQYGEFYESTNKSGASSVWKEHRKLDINNLP